MRNEPDVNVPKPHTVDGMINPMILDSFNVARCLYFSIKNSYQSCGLGRVVRRSNVDISQ